jgi:hypothetical protein
MLSRFSGAAAPFSRPYLGRRAHTAAALCTLACMTGCMTGCQVAPMGPGLMDSPPVAASPSTPQVNVGPAPAPTSANPAVPGLLDLLDRPAERALMAGLRAYDDGQYPDAEAQLRRALEGNLRATRDRSAARKMLAFIFCTTGRPAQCEAEFRAAIKDDPAFALSRGEAGHPMWGPVYKRLRGQ